MSISLISSTPASKPTLRIMACILGQRRKNKYCPSTPRVDGKTVLVTGGIAGVGEFVSRGLIERGAKVITLSRGISQGSASIPEADNLTADLADPISIINAVNQLGDTPIDILICNAGLVSKTAEQTTTGLERTFGVNVFGHHLLYRLLMKRGLLSPNARIVMTTGEIYVMANECSSSTPFDSTDSSYARSKLGNIWQVAELSKRYSDLYPIAVHPGVVASGFTGAKTGILAWFRKRLLISEEAGAQSSLIAATQALPRGAYWHNLLGIIKFPDNDIAQDTDSAACLWDELEELAAPYLL